jgi:hypothetical protein
MVYIEEPINMLPIAHHLCTEQPATVQFEWLDEIPLFSLKVCKLSDSKTEMLVFDVDGLDGFSIVIQFESREERRMSRYRYLDGTAQTVSIYTAVKDVKIRKVVTWLVFVTYAFCIDAILRS